MVGHLIALNSCVNVRLLSDDKRGPRWAGRVERAQCMKRLQLICKERKCLCWLVCRIYCQISGRKDIVTELSYVGTSKRPVLYVEHIRNWFHFLWFWFL